MKLCSWGRAAPLSLLLLSVLGAPAAVRGEARPADTTRAAFGTPPRPIVKFVDARGEVRTTGWPFSTRWLWAGLPGESWAKAPTLDATLILPPPYRFLGLSKKPEGFLFRRNASEKGVRLRIRTRKRQTELVMRIQNGTSGKSEVISFVLLLAEQSPFFWVHPSCREAGVNVTRMGVTGTPKFLFGAVNCRVGGLGTEILTALPLQVTFGAATGAVRDGRNAGQGVHWRSQILAEGDGVLEFTARQDARDGGSIRLAALRGRLEGTEYEYLEAVSEFHQEKNDDMDPADLAFDEGEQALVDGDPGEALQAFRKARQLDPKHIQAWIMEIHLLKKAGRDADAFSTAQGLYAVESRFARLPAFRRMGLTAPDRAIAGERGTKKRKRRKRSR